MPHREKIFNDVITAKVRVAVFRRVVASHTAVLVVPSLPKPAVDDLGDVALKMDAQILHSIRASVWVCGTIGVVGTLTGLCNTCTIWTTLIHVCISIVMAPNILLLAIYMYLQVATQHKPQQQLALSPGPFPAFQCCTPPAFQRATLKSWKWAWGWG